MATLEGASFNYFSLILGGEAVVLNRARAKGIGSTFKTVYGRTAKQSMLKSLQRRENWLQLDSLRFFSAFLNVYHCVLIEFLCLLNIWAAES